MARDIKQVLLACFIGGAVCAGAAILVAPSQWFLGLLAGISAGFVSGYLAYEVRQVVRAVRSAWQAVFGWRPTWTWEKTYISSIIGSLVFFYLSFIGGLVLKSAAPIWIGIYGLITCVILLVLYVPPGAAPSLAAWRRIALLINPVAILVYWPWVGLWRAVILALRGVRAAATIVPRLPSLIWRFVMAVVFQIHSSDRMICGVDGTLGGLIALLAFGLTAGSIGSAMLPIVFGGLISTALGFANKLYVLPWLVARGLVPARNDA